MDIINSPLSVGGKKSTWGQDMRTPRQKPDHRVKEATQRSASQQAEHLTPIDASLCVWVGIWSFMMLQACECFCDFMLCCL